MCKILKATPEEPDLIRVRLCYKYGPLKGTMIPLRAVDPQRQMPHGHYLDPTGKIHHVNSTRTPHARCKHGNLLQHHGPPPPGKRYWHHHWCWACHTEKRRTEQESQAAKDVEADHVML